MSLNPDAGFSQVVYKTDTIGNEFSLVPKGEYPVGEYGLKEQIVAPFYMSRFTVTKAQFLYFVKDAGYDYSTLHQKLMNKLAPLDDCPATPVSWWDAKYFVRWLRQVTGEYYSLPSEVEWEAAARGISGYTYPWGESSITDVHATISLGFKRRNTELVGSHPAGDSPFGCSDMIGNVWEWCLDSIDEENDIHVLRGGSAEDEPATCYSSYRRFESPGTKRLNYAGFRLIYLPGHTFDDYAAAHS